MVNLSKRGYDFENKVRKMLLNAGFSSAKRRILYIDVDGKKKKLEEHDIVTKSSKEKKSILISCKHAKTMKFNDELHKYSNIKRLNKYDMVIFLLGGMRLEKKDYVSAEKAGIVVWKSAQIKRIKEYTKIFDKKAYLYIFSSLGLFSSKKDAQKLKIPGIKISQPGYNFFVTQMDFKDLLKLCYVRSKDMFSRTYQKGFQRIVKSNRLNKIGEFLDKSDSVLPNSIILSTGEDSKVSSRGSYIIIKAKPLSLSLIDGQHRVYGFLRRKKKGKYPLLVVIFNKLSSNVQGKIFQKINSEQKKISSSLLLSLFEYSDKEDTQFHVGAIIKKLNEDSESPWKGFIDPIGDDQSLPIKNTRFATPLNQLIKNKFIRKNYLELNKWNPSELGKIVISYSRAIKKILKNKWKDPNEENKKELPYFMSSNGLIVLYNLLLFNIIKKKQGELLLSGKDADCWRLSKNYNYSFFIKTLKGLNKFNWEQYNDLSGGFGSSKKIYDNLIKKIPYFFETNKIHDVEEVPIGKILDNGENQFTEFKASLIWDYKLQRENKDLKEPIIKTICGFLNSDGGRLLIGVDDKSYEVIGLKRDFELIKDCNKDKYSRIITEAVEKRIGGFALSRIKIRYETYRQKEVCIIFVGKSEEKIFMKTKGGDKMYIRTGNSTREIQGEEMIKYVKNRFN